MSKDRYRPLFCTQDFYLAHQTIFKMWKQQFADFTTVEKVKAWVIALTCLRRPDDWFGGARPILFVEADDKLSLLSPITVKTFFDETQIAWPKNLNSTAKLNDFLNCYRIKPLPESALRSLFKLGQKNFPLLIIDHEPTPLELLNIQIRGQRIITFNEDYETWPDKLYGERDTLSFIIHDLIHADHFFKDEKQHQGQIGFYKLIHTIYHDADLEKLFLNEKFKSGFEYIISDMNAHPVHLFQTFKALLDLAVNENQMSNAIWNRWIIKWNLTSDQADSVQKINTQLFFDIHANHIEAMCFKKSCETGLAIQT